MNQIKKQIGSLFLSVCMIVAMLPVMAFADTQELDADTGLKTSSEITDFAALDEDIVTQIVEVGTAEDELNLPDRLTVTVTKMVTITTSSDITSTANENDSNAGSQVQEPKTQKEVQTETQEIQEQTTVPVSLWVANERYDGETTGNYIFTPTVDLPEGLTMAQGISIPTITVTVEEGAPLSLFSLGSMETVTLPTVTPKTTEELEDALTSDTPKNIVIHSLLHINNDITIGANHTLSIDPYNQISMIDGCLTIPTGMALTVNGDGEFSSDNTHSKALMVEGDLILNGVTFTIKSFDNYIYGALHATDCDIRIENTFGNGFTMGTDAELEIQGGSLHINNSDHAVCGIDRRGDNLIMIKECDVRVTSSGPQAIAIAGNVFFKDSTILFEMDGQGSSNPLGIVSNFLTFDNCEVALKNRGEQ